MKEELAIPGYEWYKPKYDKPFEEMNEFESKENLNYFLEQMPCRLDMLALALRETAAQCSLDHSESSLADLGTWFASHVHTSKKSNEQLLRDHLAMPELLHEYVEDWELTGQTISLCYDVGIYFSTLLKDSVVGTKWSVVNKPRNDIDYHRPVLISAKGGERFNPLLIMSNVAYRVVRGSANACRLPELYSIWKKNLTAY